MRLHIMNANQEIAKRLGRVKPPRPRRGRPKQNKVYVSLALPFYLYAPLLGFDIAKIADYVFSHLATDDIKFYNQLRMSRSGNLRSKSCRAGLHSETAIRNMNAIKDRNRSLAFRDAFAKYSLKHWIDLGYARPTTFDEFFANPNENQ